MHKDSNPLLLTLRRLSAISVGVLSLLGCVSNPEASLDSYVSSGPVAGSPDIDLVFSSQSLHETLDGDTWAYIEVHNESTEIAYALDFEASFLSERGVELDLEWRWGDWVWLNPGESLIYADYVSLEPATEMLGLPIANVMPAFRNPPIGWVADDGESLGISDSDLTWSIDGKIITFSAELRNLSSVALSAGRTQFTCTDSQGNPTFFGFDYGLGNAYWGSGDEFSEDFPPAETFELDSEFDIVSAGEISACEIHTFFYPPEFVSAGIQGFEQSSRSLTGEILPEWEFVGEPLFEGSVLKAQIQVDGEPTFEQLRGLAPPVVSFLRERETYSALEVEISGEVPVTEVTPNGTRSLGRYLDTPYGLDLDEVSDETHSSYASFVITGEVIDHDWSGWPTDSDLETWRDATDYRFAAANTLMSCREDIGSADCINEASSQGALLQAADLGIPVEEVLLAIQRVRKTFNYESFTIEE